MPLLRQTSAYWFLAAKKDLKVPLEVASLDNIPGGVKMACGSLAIALLMWTSLQFGVQFGLMSPVDIQALRIPVSLQAYEAYISSFAGWPSLYTQKPAQKKIANLPHVNDHDISNSVQFSELNLGRETRMENNLVWSNTRVRQETPQHGQLIESCPSAEAMKYGKDGLIAARASLYMSHKHCQTYGVDDEDCGAFVMSMNMSSTSLGDKCAAQYNNKGECSSKYRSADGSCNHAGQIAWGKAHTSYMRLLDAQYADGIQEPRKQKQGKSLPSARSISTEMTRENNVEDSIRTMSLVQWAEFVEHDLSHTPVTKMMHSGNSIMCCRQDGSFLAPRYIHPSCMPISVANNDPFYSKYRLRCMNYVRSLNVMRPDCHFGPAEQMNQATHMLDASMIYGTTDEKTKALRTYSKGQLVVEMKDGHEYLPQTDKPMQHCQVTSNTSACYKSGDMRVNLHPQLTVMHTLWYREHNRIAEELAALNPQWDDETLFQESRRIVIAQMQHITYKEWMPLVIGSKYLKKLGLEMKNKGFSSDFSDEINPGVSNSFATAAMKFRLSMVDGNVGLYNEDRTTSKNLKLRNHFNKPETIEEEEHFDSLVRGLATQSSQRNDLFFSNDLTQMLYKEDSEFGMDVVSLDIQRGRDHGLPGYNQFRKFCGRRPAQKFNDFLDVMTKSAVNKLKKLYTHPDDVDLFIGGMAERPIDDSPLGYTFRCILGEQFVRTKKGDRFFYDVPNRKNSFSDAQVNEIKKASLARVFCDNSNDIQSMQPNVFMKTSDSTNNVVSCSNTDKIKKLNLEAWKEEMKRVGA
ncbi:hypothetical protein C0J52_03325 [Blattella germanica]|nr:hypothetical protein C0J52_03325 [Blattella germanica]